MMNGMEVSIISREVIKPSSPAVHLLKPWKLSFLDQLTPTFYTPLILFYPANPNVCFNTSQISIQLKKSLSETLNHLYFLSGRVKNNLFIDDYEHGVSFTEARVKSRMSNFLEQPQLELLNEFLPYQPFCKELDPESASPLALQVNVFDCGGIALGLSLSHKIVDGGTLKVILDNWAAISRGCHDKVASLGTHMFEGSLRFPQLDFVPNELSPVESLRFMECRYTTKRFLFDANAIARLKTKARSELVENPTRCDALSCFIWKSTIAAMGGSSLERPYMLRQAINIRRKAKPRLSDNSIGNLFVWAVATLKCSDSNAELHELVNLLREAYAETENLKLLRGIMEYKNLFENCFNENPVILSFTSWLDFGFEKPDFGWGKPVWVGVMGKGGPFIWNFTILKMASWRDQGIEAWITLGEKEMEMLENDPQFLEFASPSPTILTP